MLVAGQRNGDKLMSSDQIERLGVMAKELAAVRAALEAGEARLRAVADGLESPVLRTEVARLHTQHGVLVEVENGLASLAVELGSEPGPERQTIPVHLVGAPRGVVVRSCLYAIPHAGETIVVCGRGYRVDKVVHEAGSETTLYLTPWVGIDEVQP